MQYFADINANMKIVYSLVFNTIFDLKKKLSAPFFRKSSNYGIRKYSRKYSAFKNT